MLLLLGLLTIVCTAFPQSRFDTLKSIDAAQDTEFKKAQWIEGLTSCPDSAARFFVREHAVDSVLIVRTACYEAIAKLQMYDAVHLLLSAWDRTADATVLDLSESEIFFERSHIASALVVLGRTEFKSFILRNVVHPDKCVRFNMVLALGRIGGIGELENLIDVLVTDSTEFVSGAALWEIVRLRRLDKKDATKTIIDGRSSYILQQFGVE